MKRYLLFVILTLTFNSIFSQINVDWAKTIGDGRVNYESKLFGISPKNGDIIIAGDRGANHDFDPTHQVVKLKKNESYFQAFFITCYDSVGNFKWVKGIPQKDNNILNFTNLLFDNNGNLYFTGYPNKDRNYATNGDTIIGKASNSEFAIVKYDKDGNFVDFANFGKGFVGYGNVKIRNNQLWISGSVFDSIWFDLKNKTQLYTTKNNAFIAKYNLDFSYLKHTILSSAQTNKIHDFDIDGNTILMHHQIGTNTHKLLHTDSNLNILTDSFDYVNSLVNIVIDEAKGYLLYGKIDANFTGMRIRNWAGDTLFHFHDDAWATVDINDYKWDAKNDLFYLKGKLTNVSFYIPTSRSYVREAKNWQGIIKIKTPSQFKENIDVTNTNNHYTSLHLGLQNQLYYLGWYQGTHYLDVAKGFRHERKLGVQKNILLARYTDKCNPIEFENTIDTLTYCGFTTGDKISLNATGTGLRYQWYQDGVELEDEDRAVQQYVYRNLGTNTPHLTTTYGTGKDNSWDTVLMRCKITSVCQADTQTKNYSRIIYGKPLYQPNKREYNLIAGDSLIIPIINHQSDYPVNYQWYANGLALFDNAVITGTQSDSLKFSNTKNYHSGVYNIGITPKACPELEFISWDYTVNFNLSSVEKLLAESFSLYPNPTKENLNIKYDGNEPVSAIKIYSASGLEILHLNTNSLLIEPINTIRFIPGLYHIHFITQNGSTTKKFIKL